MAAKQDSSSTATDFRRGEPQAIEEVRRYVRRILAFRGLRLAHEELADIEQRVMTQVWQLATRPDFDPVAGFWGLVETVTARRSIDALRRNRPTAELPESLEDPARDPLATVLAEERVELARNALGQLEPECRQLIELHAVRRLTYREIAPILGASPGALRVRMHRCVAAARRLLAEQAGPKPRAAASEKRR